MNLHRSDCYNRRLFSKVSGIISTMSVFLRFRVLFCCFTVFFCVFDAFSPLFTLFYSSISIFLLFFLFIVTCMFLFYLYIFISFHAFYQCSNAFTGVQVSSELSYFYQSSRSFFATFAFLPVSIPIYRLY